MAWFRENSIRPERLDINLKQTLPRQTSHIKHTLQIIISIFQNLSPSVEFTSPRMSRMLPHFIRFDLHTTVPPTDSDPFFLGFPCSNNLHMSRRLGVEAKKSRSKQSMKYLQAIGSIFEDVFCVYIYISYVLLNTYAYV